MNFQLATISNPTLQRAKSQTNSALRNDDKLIADWLYNKSRRTAQDYFSNIREFYRFTGNLSVKQVTKKTVIAYIEHLKQRHKRATINKKLSCLKSLLKHAAAEDYIEKNPAANIDRLKRDAVEDSLEANERVIGNDEVWKLINSTSNERDYVLLKTVYLLGLRVSEVVHLHWRNVTREGSRYKVKVIGKNNRVAFLSVDKQLYRQWKRLSARGYIFRSRKQQGRLSPSWVHKIVKKAAKRAGLDDRISPHWLRHQRASDLVNSGRYTLSQVQRFLRHSSPATTSNYIHVTNEIGSDDL